MKTLIFALIISTFAEAASGDPNEVRLSDSEISLKLVSVARDVQNEQILKDATELQSCRDTFQRTPNPSDATAIKALETCIQGKIGSAANAESLSEKLDLETYKLIPSTTVKNVTEYLTKKMYLQLTGVDIEEQDTAKKIQAMKFNNKKQVDHKDFYDLYKNQIAKNALQEVSRFCLLEFRNSTNGSADNFMAHWGNLADFAGNNRNPSTFPISLLSDSATPPFEQNPTGSTTPTTADPQSSYTSILRNIFNGTIPDTKKLENFFFFCGKKINELCENYERQCTTTTSQNQANRCPSTAIGGKACLTKTRLTAYRRAMKSSDKIAEEFGKDNGADITLALDRNEMVKRYQRGSGAGDEKSLNEITNNASIDFFKAKQQSSQDAEDCIANGKQDCDNFVIVDDSETRIEANTTLVLTVKREAELVRVRDLVKKGGQDLDKYLEENYPDLKEKNKNPPAGFDLVTAISQRWDARREALIAEIKRRIGERQVTQTEIKNQGSTDKVEEVGQKNAKESLNEKTRLSQVVFFNNIISSSLNLQTQSGQSLGRNVQALDNEIAGAENEVQGSLFDGLKALGSNGGSSGGSNTGNQLTGNESVTNIDFLDEFIGIPNTP